MRKIFLSTPSPPKKILRIKIFKAALKPCFKFPKSGGNTGLIYAATKGQSQAIACLLEHGAEVNKFEVDSHFFLRHLFLVQSRGSCTAAMCAAYGNHPAALRVLEHGADLTLKMDGTEHVGGD
jgi:hypothetical protein